MITFVDVNDNNGSEPKVGGAKLKVKSSPYTIVQKLIILITYYLLLVTCFI